MIFHHTSIKLVDMSHFKPWFHPWFDSLATRFSTFSTFSTFSLIRFRVIRRCQAFEHDLFLGRSSRCEFTEFWPWNEGETLGKSWGSWGVSTFSENFEVINCVRSASLGLMVWICLNPLTGDDHAVSVLSGTMILIDHVCFAGFIETKAPTRWLLMNSKIFVACSDYICRLHFALTVRIDAAIRVHQPCWTAVSSPVIARWKLQKTATVIFL